MFAVREFRALWLAQLLSVAGDQLARVALTVGVYDRTRSAFLAALTFVMSVVPVFIGGVTLAGLADRFSRRAVMVVCDVARCALVLLMAVPGVPLVVLVALLFVVTLIGAPFTAARAAIYPDVLTGDRYVVGTAVTLTTNQFAQVAGFAVGGLVVGALGMRTSLVIDAATYAASAVIVRVWVLSRAAPATATASAGERGRRTGGPLNGARLVFGSRAMALPMLFGWLAAFYNAPEGVAAPLGRSVGGGATAVGMILAALALGETVGVIVLSRLVPAAVRARLLGPLAVGSCAVLLLFVTRPHMAAMLLILLASGICGGYQVTANAAFVRAVPNDRRSQAFGLAQGGMSLGQGVVMLLAGALAQRFNPAEILAAIGGVGTASACILAASWVRRPGLYPTRGSHRGYSFRHLRRRAYRRELSG